MKVDLWPINRVNPYFGNPRVHDSAVDAIAALLKEFGFREPVVIDSDGVIIVGHSESTTGETYFLFYQDEDGFVG